LGKLQEVRQPDQEIGDGFRGPLMLHGAHKASEAAIRAHAEVYAQRLLSHPDWPEIEDLPEGVACDVPLTARPMENFAEST
jgi:glutathione-regulated potassium-efflux system ancillary protein KefF